jgi:hypothetical protein
MPPIAQRYPYADTWQAAWDFAKATLPLEPKPFWTGDGIEAYRLVQPESSDTFTLDLGAAGTFPYRGEGWDAAETDAPYDTTAIWATGASSRLFVPLRQVDPTATYRITARVHPFAYPNGPQQRVALVVNSADFAEQPLSAPWQETTWLEVRWEVPGAQLIDGLNRLELRWAQQAVPRDVLGGTRAIGATGVQLPIDADIKAFAEGAFIALFDANGDQIDASAGRRGVNVTVLDPTTGAVLEKVGFDTAANAYESEALASYLAALPAGSLTLVASSGDATAYLTPAAVEGLRGLGADVTVESLQGNAFAVIGVQGAAPGSAAQSIAPGEAFLSVSLNRDRRPLAAAVDWVEVGR